MALDGEGDKRRVIFFGGVCFRFNNSQQEHITGKHQEDDDNTA